MFLVSCERLLENKYRTSPVAVTLPLYFKMTSMTGNLLKPKIKQRKKSFSPSGDGVERCMCVKTNRCRGHVLMTSQHPPAGSQPESKRKAAR